VTVPPAIDYTDKDFRSLRDAMLRLAQQRLPEWTDQSPADLGMLLVDLFAYMGDIAFYYQDRIASDLFPSTAVEQRSIVDLLRLIGYELAPVTPAMADLLLTFAAPAKPGTVTVPHGARFGAHPAEGATVEFCYLGPDLEIPLASSRLRETTNTDGAPVVQLDGIPVEQSTPVGPIVIGSSRGEPNQVFALPGTGVVRDSVQVQVEEGAGWVRWDRRDSLLFDVAADGRAQLSHPDARHYQLLVAADGVTHAVFGDGRRPPPGTNNVRATYRVSGGAAGNLAAGTIVEALTPIATLRSVVNPHDSAGGSDLERADHAIRYAPLAFRSMNRAVTESDYVALAQRTGTVSKVRAASHAWNQIDLHVVPAGPSWRPVPEALRLWLLAYFEDKRMAGTLVRILDTESVPVDISLDLTVDGRFVTDSVVSQTESAVAALLAFDVVDFGQTLFASDVYAVAEAVPGVSGVLVRRFRRRDAVAPDIEEQLARHNLPAIHDLPAFLRAAISSEVPGGGRIELGEFELPALGQLEVTTRTGPPE
jgi:hypothetical protein